MSWASLYNGDFGYWELRHKVTFDGVSKLIIVNEGESSIDIRRDIYSAWVEWMYLSDNSKYLPAMRFTGGDPTVGGQSTGLVFFLINGWRITFDRSVTFIGSIFSDNYSSPFIVPENTFIGQSVVSSLVTQASSGAGSEITPEQIANSVWAALLSPSAPMSSAAGKLNSVPTKESIAAEVSETLTIPTKEEVAEAVWEHQVQTTPPLTAKDALLQEPSVTIDPSTITDAIWDAPTAEHATEGTFGHYIQKKLLTIALFFAGNK